ncbi:MAG: hypothetical protein GF364_11400 [Candidatus Lokiarchaeota archaeon]|nr:hypothetical protein [Candidatus Lokiarchaeota archaeon]
MSKTVFEHISEQVDQVVKGRRYIIAEIGKLKVSVEDLKEVLEVSSMGDLASSVSDLKNFIQTAVNTLGNLKNSVSQLSSSISSLSTTVQNTYNVVKDMKSGGGMPMSSAPKPSMPSMPSMGAPKPSMPSMGAPKPSMPSMPSMGAPKSAPSVAAPQSSSGGNTGSKFDNILSAAKSGTNAKDLGGMIDKLRSELSKANPLDSKLFELSMEAGRLKSLGDKALDQNALSTLEQKINKWKSQG